MNKTISNFLTLLFLLPIPPLPAQDIPINTNTIDLEILTADTLVKGIYKDIAEFQNNSPSYRGHFTISKKNQGTSYNYEHTFTGNLLIVDSANMLVRYGDDFWGLCDGEKVFICFHGKFRLLSVDGRYCQFSEFQVSSTYSLSSSYARESWLILDALNGKTTRLNISSLTEILERENPALLEEFNKEADKKAMLSTYIERLNKTYNYR